MTTKVYGASDDLIEFEGELYGEVSAFVPDRDGESIGVLVAFSDGTVLSARYGKNGEGIWQIMVLHAGDLFEKLDLCGDSEAEIHSDVAHFKDGKLKAWVGKNAERVA